MLRTIVRLLTLLRPFWRLMVLAVMLSAAAVASNIGLLSTSAYLIVSAALHPSVATLQVAIVGVRFFGIARAVFRYGERLTAHSVNFRLLAGLRVALYRSIEPNAPANLVDRQGGDLLSSAIGDIDTLENFYVRAVAPPVSALLITLCMSIWFVKFDVRLGGLLLSSLVLGGIALPLIIRVLAQAPGKALVARRTELMAHAVDLLQGLDDLHALNQTDIFSERVEGLGNAVDQAQLRLSILSALGNALVLTINGLALTGVLWIGVTMVGSRMNGVMLAVLALATMASFEVVTPLIEAARHLESSGNAAERLFNLADAHASIQTHFNSDLPPVDGVIQVSGVSFRYPHTDHRVLEDISLRISPGRRVALVGPSGAGKSSLMRLLLRFYEWGAGDISLNESSFRTYDPELIRTLFAVVTQSSYIFSSSLRANLKIAAPQAEDADLWDVLQQVGLAETTSALPLGLDSAIGEHGTQFSGGERRRLDLARALLRPAPFLLLDEPTAHLDVENEKRFMDVLYSLGAKRGILLITHRLIGLENFDEVIVLQNGRITERGTFSELVTREGWFAAMLRIQRDQIEGE